MADRKAIFADDSTPLDLSPLLSPTFSLSTSPPLLSPLSTLPSPLPLPAPRDMFYTAQENLRRIEPRYRRISHPNLHSAFPSFSPSLGKFVPSPELAYDYPGNGSPPPPLPLPHDVVEAVLSHASSFSRRLGGYLDAVKAQEREEERKGEGKGMGIGEGEKEEPANR